MIECLAAETLKLQYENNYSSHRLGDEERTVMHLVPAAAVRLMKRRVLSRPGVRSLDGL